jgi:hypothetical protein
LSVTQASTYLPVLEARNESQVAELRRNQRAAEREGESLLEWRAALLAKLARFPDDGVVTAILEAPRGIVLGCNETLLSLGSRSACAAVVESIRVWEEELVALETYVADLGAGTTGMDKAIAEGLRDVLLEDLAKRRDEGRARLPELVRLVEERGLGPAPELSDHPHTSWKRWLDAHFETLPEHLPGVSSPVW